jgi:hypothetical protein
MAGLLAGLAGLILFIWLRLPAATKPIEVSAESENRRQGREIRYNATLSLAVIGSDKVRLDLLREMLDEDKQLKYAWVKLKNGQTVSDEAAGRKTVLNALKAFVEWHDKVKAGKRSGLKNKKVEEIYAAIRHLAVDSPNGVVRKEAKDAAKALNLD